MIESQDIMDLDIIKELKERREFSDKVFAHVKSKAKVTNADKLKLIYALKAHVDVEEQVTKFLVADMMKVAQHLQMFELESTRSGGNLVALIKLLIEKGVITTEELKGSWETNVLPMLNQGNQEVDEDEEEEEATDQPHDPEE